MGTTGLESAFAVLYTELVLPGVLDARDAARAAHRRRAPARARAPRSPSASRANLCLIDLDARWRIGEAGYESRSANCCFAGREVSGRILLTIAAGAVAYRERAFAAERRMSYVLLEDGTRFDGEGVGAPGR